VWETLLDAGADLGCRPFGVEAQRIMRLEKGHLIVGQDSDGLTSGYAAGLDWLIKPDKPDFLGRAELAWVAEGGGPASQLVGLQPVDDRVVPPEGCQIVEGTTIVGRITSSRMSPTLGRSICLGYVASRLAAAGTVVSVRLPTGAETPVTVMAELAHFDPEGRRLRG
jgi:sarcosine oxidase subunit alpha